MRLTRHLLPLLCGVTVLGLLLPSPAKARRQVGFGQLELSSRTEGAVVFVDGVVVGKVPLRSVVRLRAGQHTVKLAKKGYTQYLDVIRVTTGEVARLDIDLIPLAGVLAVTANVPKARVYVDGTFVGIAPVEAEALVGPRTVRVTKAGFHDFITRVKAVGGKRHEITVRLEELPVGASPYRPAPPPPPQWYEKWYIWAGAAAGLTAIAVAIVVPVVLTRGDPIDDFCQGQCAGGGYSAQAN